MDERCEGLGEQTLFELKFSTLVFVKFFLGKNKEELKNRACSEIDKFCKFQILNFQVEIN